MAREGETKASEESKSLAVSVCNLYLLVDLRDQKRTGSVNRCQEMVHCLGVEEDGITSEIKC